MVERVNEMIVIADDIEVSKKDLICLNCPIWEKYGLDCDDTHPECPINSAAKKQKEWEDKKKKDSKWLKKKKEKRRKYYQKKKLEPGWYEKTLKKNRERKRENAYVG